MKLQAFYNKLLIDLVPLRYTEDYLMELSDIERAILYPYSAPSEAYILANGRLYELDQKIVDKHYWLFESRTPVLSVGSNRAPTQLLRKFGHADIIPVTPARLLDCDVVHAAMISYYAAVPCTAYPSEGCVVDLNVAWLTPTQLEKMHKTEGVGASYDYVIMRNVLHILRLPETPIYGYSAKSGVVNYCDGKPAALPAIKAMGRRFPTASQRAIVTHIRKLTGHYNNRSYTEFIDCLNKEKATRFEINAVLQKNSIHYTEPPWHNTGFSIDKFDDC